MKPWQVGLLIAGIVLAVGAYTVYDWYQTEGGNTASAPQVTDSSTSTHVLRNGAGSVVVASTKEALDEMSTAGSDDAIAAIVLAGDGFLVDQGTEVSLIGVGVVTQQIRVLGGPMYGRTGFVPTEWVVEE